MAMPPGADPLTMLVVAMLVVALRVIDVLGDRFFAMGADAIEAGARDTGIRTASGTEGDGSEHGSAIKLFFIRGSYL